MRISDVLNDDLSPKWENIWEIPEFKACIGLDQNKEWHQESLDEHIKMVTERMWSILNHPEAYDFPFNYSNVDKKALMLAALCHDLGKPLSTYFDPKDQQYHSKNHGQDGDRITRMLLFDCPDIEFREKVCWMVRWHMELHHILKGDGSVNQNKFANLLCGHASIYEMLLLFECDSVGCLNDKNDRESDIKNIINTVYLQDLDAYSDREDQNWWFYKCRRDYKVHDRHAMNKVQEYPTIYMMVGVSGGGKSTYVEKYLQDKATAVSRDIIRIQLGMCDPGTKFKGTKEQEEDVTKMFDREVGRLLKEGRSVIIDNMNTRLKYRNETHKKYMKYNPRFVYVYCEAPTFEDHVERRVGQVDEQILKQMFKDMDFPQPYEYDEIIYRKTF